MHSSSQRGGLSVGVRFAASLARKVYLRQNLGVGILRNHYGGRNKRKVTPCPLAWFSL